MDIHAVHRRPAGLKWVLPAPGAACVTLAARSSTAAGQCWGLQAASHLRCSRPRACCLRLPNRWSGEAYPASLRMSDRVESRAAEQQKTPEVCRWLPPNPQTRFKSGVIPPAGSYDGYWVDPYTLFFIEVIAMQFAELKRWQDFSNPGSQAKQYFLGLEQVFGGSGNPAYPGGQWFNMFKQVPWVPWQGTGAAGGEHMQTDASLPDVHAASRLHSNHLQSVSALARQRCAALCDWQGMLGGALLCAA